MRFEGPPGMVLDLIGPSPTAVDVEWTHPYTNAPPYRNTVREPPPPILDPRLLPRVLKEMPSAARCRNPYAYVDNNPINFRDPSGLDASGTNCDEYKRLCDV